MTIWQSSAGWDLKSKSSAGWDLKSGSSTPAALALALPAAADKSQRVRLIDVFVLGPFMLWAAWRAGTLPLWARWTLAASGAATVWYNGRNYLRRRESE